MNGIKKIPYYIILLSFLAASCGCKKDISCKEDNIVHNCIKQQGYVCMYYDVTKCEAAGISDSTLLKNKIDYLKQKGVNEIIDAYIDDNECAEVCDACTCRNGKRIYGKVKEGDLQIMLKSKFKELK